MSATLLSEALNAGLDLQLDGEIIKVAGRADVVKAWAPRLIEHKAELIERLRESSLLTIKLLEAAMRVCDHHGDSDSAREQMKQDVLQHPPHLLPDLLQHFESVYPSPKQHPRAP